MLISQVFFCMLSLQFPVDLNTEITAQCGRITQPNRMACNGVIHQVDRVLLPAELDTIETLKTQRDFSIFYRLLVVRHVVLCNL